MSVPRTYQLPTFLDETVPVDLLASLDGVEVDGSSVTLRCAVRRYRPELQDYYGTVSETVFVDPEPAGQAVVRLDWCTQDIMRIRVVPDGHDLPDERTPMVVGRFADPPRVTVDEDDTHVHIRAGALTLTVDRDPLRLTLRDAGGTVVWRTRAVDIEAFAGNRPEWDTVEQRWIFHHRYGYPTGWTAGGLARAFLTVDLHHDEHVYGFGESFGPVDKRGTQQRLWLEEAFSNTSPASYKRVPFYFTSRGYGLFVHSSNAMTFRVGDLDHTAISAVIDDTSTLDCYLIHGPTPAEILPRYTAITGAPALPPLWTFGLWMSRITYASQDEVEEVAADLRRHEIPCDVIHIDTGWFAREYVCDLEFGPQFPDPAAMTRRLADEGFRATLWQWPNVVLDSPLFAEALEGDYLARRTSGHAYTYAGGYGQDAGLIDYSDPRAVAWVQDKIEALLRQGIAAIKVDYGEGAPPDAVYAGVESPAAHNRYPLLYQQAIWEATERVHGAGQAVLWARSAWAGSQRYPVHWSGDGVARFADLACVLRATLSFGLSGFPFYSHDIGGFSGVPTPQLYVRWAQLGLLSSHARAHGSPPREPWAYGPEAEAAFRTAAELRYRLLPYLWTEAAEAARASLPLVRPLLIDHPDDPVAARVEDQYLLGRDLLVAPILDERDRRRVYLPAGAWVDHRSGEVVDGGCYVDVEAALHEVPIYVRAGAIIPQAPLAQHTGAVDVDHLVATLYAPRASTSRVVRWPDHDDITIVVEGEGEGDGLRVTVAGATHPRVEVVGSDLRPAGDPTPRPDGLELGLR